MKLNNICENTRVDSGLMNTFIMSQNGANFDFGDDDILDQSNELFTLMINKTLIDKIDLIDSNGILKIPFGNFAGGFILRNIHSLKSLKNIPKKCDVLELDNLSIKHADFQNSDIEYIRIDDCNNLNKISNININVLKILEVNSCAKFTLENTKLPKYMPQLRLLSLDAVKTFDEHNETIVDKLSIYYFKNLESWRHIETYGIKKYLDIYDTLQLNNFINVMLIKTDKIANNNPKIDFFEKYSKMQNRQDYIMDFAVELIDAGLDEAAEL